MAETAGQVLRAATAALRHLGIETAALDARLLLEAASGMDHAALIAEPERVLSTEQLRLFAEMMSRRTKFEPVSRILGQREFYGRVFHVSPAVLDPRPDTEVLIDCVLSHGRTGTINRLLDLGTGSGILALTLLAEWPSVEAVAVDVSADALAVAEKNAEVLGVRQRLKLVQSDWFSRVEGKFDLIVSNPPYIPEAHVAGLAPDVRNYDPQLALMGGDDGLDPYRVIANQAPGFLGPSGAVFVEIGMGQELAVSALFIASGFNQLGQFIDLGGRVRALGFCLE